MNIYIVAPNTEKYMLDATYLDICKVYTNCEKARNYAEKRSKESSFFDTYSVYKVELDNYFPSYPEFEIGYKKGEEIISAE